MPRTKKPAGTAVDRRNGRRAELALGPVLEVDLPRPRESYQPLALSAWDGYWSQPVAATVTEADLMIAWAWIDAYDHAMVMRSQADAEPVVTGSMGQQVANPLYQVANASMSLAMQCAKQLGIGGKNRADLGLALFAGQQAAFAAGQQADPEGEGEDDDEDDPR
jgi:hypothetical protein